MENLSQPSSSISFTSSSHISNGSIGPNVSSSGSKAGPSLELISLTKLSSNLEQILSDNTCDYSDADIIVENIPVGVHRCILAARSKFFYDLFKQDNGHAVEIGKKPKYNMNQLLPHGKVGHESFLVFLNYLYTGKLKPPPMESSTCVDNVCNHDSCGPAVNFAVELMYASYTFQIPELVSVFQRRLVNFVGRILVEDVIPILMVAYHCDAGQLLTQCVDRIARSNLDNVTLEKELPHEIAGDIKLLNRKSLSDSEENTEEMEAVEATVPFREKSIRRIHKALDSDDVELVKLLLSESGITLDTANVLHYAAAYCDPKVVHEVLNLGGVDVNRRNSRGYTVLHLAARRREPSVILSLLNKGASALDLTSDGQSAVSICRRLTRPKDYHAKTEQGKETNKDRLCIDVLEREMRRNPTVAVSSTVPQTMTEDLHMKLLYLENRVAFARLFFPSEAKVAMSIANADTTSEFAGLSLFKGSSGSVKEVDLNETPVLQEKRLRSRLESLMKTVETGRRYFPHCSEVLDKFMEDDLPDLFYLDQGTRDERNIKRARYLELKQDVQKAFSKDKADSRRSGLSPSSSSSSLKGQKVPRVGLQ